MNQEKELEDLILQTLSFYEPMSFSKIVFDMDTELLKTYPDFDRDKMLSILTKFEKAGLVQKQGEGTESLWIRTLKPRSQSLFKKIKMFFIKK